MRVSNRWTENDIEYGYTTIQGAAVKVALVPIDAEILDRLRAYLDVWNDTETTISAIIAQWIDHQKVKDMEDSQ